MALVHFTKENFNEILENNKVVVVDFFATWCNPCKMLGPVIESIAEELEGKAIVGKVDVDQASDLAEEYDVMSVPTVYIFVNGKIVDSSIGYKSKVALLDQIKKYL